MCMCVQVSLRNGFLKNKGALDAKSPTTKRYTQVLDQINAMISQILTKKNNLSTIPKHSQKLIRHQPNSCETQNNKIKKEKCMQITTNQPKRDN